MQVTNRTKLNMVIGYPLTHSQSPELHHAAYQLLGIDAVLLAQPHLQLKSLIQAVKIMSIELTAVTSPYKEKVVKYLDECSDEVKELQAANTIIQCNGKLCGYNTDVDGIAFALRGIEMSNKNVLVIGAGGAARALGYFLKKHHAKLFWMNRTKRKAVALAKKFSGEVISQDNLSKVTLDIIINTTTVGLYPNVNASPFPEDFINSNQVVFDMIYHPMMTKLLIQAKNRGAKIISGLEMFIGQGLKQIELLTEKTLDEQMVVHLREMLIGNQQIKT